MAKDLSFSFIILNNIPLSMIPVLLLISWIVGCWIFLLVYSLGRSLAEDLLNKCSISVNVKEPKENVKELKEVEGKKLQFESSTLLKATVDVVDYNIELGDVHLAYVTLSARRKFIMILTGIIFFASIVIAIFMWGAQPKGDAMNASYIIIYASGFFASISLSIMILGVFVLSYCSGHKLLHAKVGSNETGNKGLLHFLFFAC